MSAQPEKPISRGSLTSSPKSDFRAALALKNASSLRCDCAAAVTRRAEVDGV